jgi:uncharacterized protein
MSDFFDDDPPTPPAETTQKPKKPRGFAAMSPEMRKAISKKGGIAAHALGTAHQFTSAEARLAGSKGGRAAAAKKAEASDGAVKE